MADLRSGADHERVAAANPHWDERDWCWYWEKDLRKSLKKIGETRMPDRLTDCGEGCKCRII